MGVVLDPFRLHDLEDHAFGAQVGPFQRGHGRAQAEFGTIDDTGQEIDQEVNILVGRSGRRGRNMRLAAHPVEHEQQVLLPCPRNQLPG